jgi:hypothetical protein
MPKFIPDFTGGYILKKKGEYMCKVQDTEGYILQVPREEVDEEASVGHQVAFREHYCNSCEVERMYDQKEEQYYCPVCE